MTTLNPAARLSSAGLAVTGPARRCGCGCRPAGAGTLAGDISAPGVSLSPLSVRLLLKARQGAGGRVTAERGPARCRGQARATISLPPRRAPGNHSHHRSGLETSLAVDSPGTQQIHEPEGA